MKISMIGLGRMDGNMARRLSGGGVDVVAYNRSFNVTEALTKVTDDAMAKLVAMMRKGFGGYAQKAGDGK